MDPFEIADFIVSLILMVATVIAAIAAIMTSAESQKLAKASYEQFQILQKDKSLSSKPLFELIGYTTNGETGNLVFINNGHKTFTFENILISSHSMLEEKHLNKEAEFPYKYDNENETYSIILEKWTYSAIAQTEFSMIFKYKNIYNTSCEDTYYFKTVEGSVSRIKVIFDSNN